MVAFSIGRSMTTLIVGRFIQGAAAASVSSVGTAILADAFTNQGMGLVMGVLDMLMALGTVSGPVAGGLVYHYYGYRSVFLSAYILIALDLAFRLLMLERNRGDCLDSRNHNHQPRLEDSRYIEYSHNGSIKQTTGVASSHATYGAILSGSSSVTDVTSSTSSSVFSAPEELLSEISSEPRHSPMIELLLMPRMQVCLLGDFIYNIILNGLESVLPLKIKIVFGYSSKEVALILLMLAIPSFAGPVIGYLGDKFGPRRLVFLGFASMSPLLASLSTMSQPNFDRVVLLCALLLMIGVCLNVILTPLFLDVTYLVDERAASLQHCRMKPMKPKKAYAEAYALMSIACACGSLCGPLLGGLVDYVGWSSWTIGAGLLCALTSFPSFLFLGGLPKLGHGDR